MDVSLVKTAQSGYLIHNKNNNDLIYKLVYLNGNNAAEGENNIKYANSYPMNWTVKNWFAQDIIWIVMIGNELKLLLGWVLCGIE